VSVTIDVAPTLSVRCDPQDADEMLGNLLDNAFKWAHSEVRITGAIADSVAIVSIADDGPGLSSEDAERALQRGERLDETVAGTGFGLPITQEIATLYGGTLVLEKSRSGGLDARLTLPV
jgi:signal transduction histidine kinase